MLTRQAIAAHCPCSHLGKLCFIVLRNVSPVLRQRVLQSPKARQLYHSLVPSTPPSVGHRPTTCTPTELPRRPLRYSYAPILSDKFLLARPLPPHKEKIVLISATFSKENFRYIWKYGNFCVRGGWRSLQSKQLEFLPAKKTAGSKIFVAHYHTHTTLCDVMKFSLIFRASRYSLLSRSEEKRCEARRGKARRGEARRGE